MGKYAEELDKMLKASGHSNVFPAVYPWPASERSGACGRVRAEVAWVTAGGGETYRENSGKAHVQTIVCSMYSNG